MVGRLRKANFLKRTHLLLTILMDIITFYMIYIVLYTFWSMLYARMAPSWYLWQVSSILLLTAVVCVMSRIRGHLSNEAKLSIDNFKKEVTGIVELYKSISLNELASKIGMKPDETERFLALMAAEGTFNGTIRDGFVFLSTEEPEKLTEKSEEQIGSTQVISEKLRKLEELYKEGKISEYAYKKLKEEYEREK